MAVVDLHLGATWLVKQKSRFLSPVLVLDDAQTGKLKSLAGSRTAPARDVARARILLACAEGQSLSAIARNVGVSRPTACKCIEKAVHMGSDAALRDFPRPGREPEISVEGKAWVVSLACRNPRTSDWLRSCGHFRRWLAMCAGKPRRLAFRACPVQVK